MKKSLWIVVIVIMLGILTWTLLAKTSLVQSLKSAISDVEEETGVVK